MKRLLVTLIFAPLAFATPSPDALLNEASKLYQVAKLPPGSVTEANLTKCLDKGAAAKEKIDLLFANYPDDAITTSFDAKRLRGQIKGAIAQCQRIKRESEKKPYVPKDRGNTANF